MSMPIWVFRVNRGGIVLNSFAPEIVVLSVSRNGHACSDIPRRNLGGGLVIWPCFFGPVISYQQIANLVVRKIVVFGHLQGVRP